MEIAKLRAMRVLWAQVVRASGGGDEAAKIRLYARSGRYNKTQFDPHVNILRGTTEAFAAVVGGADILHVAPWDAVLSQVPSELGRRLARNTQIMLREESRLDHVVDLAGGSWTVETLTHQLCVAAWKLFQDIEAMGGLKAAVEAGFPQGKIAEVAAARRKALVQRTDIVVGTNQYANALEAMPEVKTLDHAALKAAFGPKAAAARKGAVKGSSFQALVDAAPNATLGELSAALGRGNGPKVEALKAHRAAEVFEGLRKAVLAYRTQHPGAQVFLANLGPVGTYMPRLDFTRGFFQVGGFEVADQAWFKTPEEAAKAALESGAPVVVAVGLDDTYVEAVPVLAKALKAGGAKTVLMAGLLKDHADAFKAAGVDDFIHVRSDVHAVLSGLAKTMGVC
jgi:methylmalonyl-CoA mutase